MSQIKRKKRSGSRDLCNYNTDKWLWENYRSCMMERPVDQRTPLRVVSGYIVEISPKSTSTIGRFTNDDEAIKTLLAARFVAREDRGVTTYHAQ